jgi:4-amino-4-deoxy-L-arabinose transferase-like glycosyltransferase
MSSFMSVWGRRVLSFCRSRDERLSTVERVMQRLAVAACVFFAAVALWESFGPSRGGHMTTSSAYAMAGENMVHWHKFAVFTGYLANPATPDRYYCHHPYGISVLQGVGYLLLGHHWFTVRSGAIFCSVLSAPLVYAFGRRAWGVIPAAVATIFFVFVPIDLAYANFSNLEEPTIFFGLLFAWATAGLWQTWRVRYLVLATIGALGAANSDWAGLMFVGPIVIYAFFRAYALPRRWVGDLDERMHARWFAYATAAAVGTLILYLALFGKADKIGDLMGSYDLRSEGAASTLAETFSPKRKLWLSQMLTPISYGALAAGVPLAIARLWKRPLEIVPIAWFFAACFQYFAFKQGADIHIFWPHYYAPAAAMAAGTLVASLLYARSALLRLVERVRNRASPPAPAPDATAPSPDAPSPSPAPDDAWVRRLRYATAVALGLAVAVPLALLARVGVPELVQARKTGGRMDDGGRFIASDTDIIQFAEWAFSNVATRGSVVQVLEKFNFNYACEYAVGRPHARVNSLTAAKLEDPQRIAVVDTRNQSEKDLENLARQFGVQAVGPFWRVDRAIKGPQLMAHRYEEREPGPLEWMFISGTDLVRKISPEEDPFVTWEWKDALGLPAPPPADAPASLNDFRIAHNIAVSQKDAAREADLRIRLAGNVGRPAGLRYSGGVTLQGIDIQHGPAIVVTLYWATDDHYKRVDANFQVKCKVVKPPRLWVIPIEYAEKDMAPVAPIRPANWKPGYLYAQRFTALHRLGREECRGAFSADLKPLTGEPNPVIFTLD